MSVSAAPTPENSPRPAVAWGGVWCAVLLFAVMRYWVLGLLSPAFSDVPLYARYAAETVLQQRAPYREVKVEYPPLGLWCMELPARFPRLLQAPQSASDRSLREYEAAYTRRFRAGQLVCDILAALLFVNLLVRLSPRNVGLMSNAYVLVTAVLGHVLYDRLDLVLWLTIVFWANARVRAECPRGGLVWLILAYLSFGAGISLKLIPVVAVPVLVLWELRRPGRFLVAAAAVLCGVFGPFAWYWSQAGWQTFDFLQLHQARGLHVESLAATVPLLARLAGLPVRVEHEPGGFSLVSSLSAPCARLADVGLILLIVGSLWLSWRNRQGRGEIAVRYGALVLALAVAAAKVFSPQYLIWALPCGWLVLATHPQISRTAVVWSVVLGMAVAGLTTWLFPYHYFCELPTATGPRRVLGLIPELDSVAVNVLIVRNLLFAAWCGLVFRAALFCDSKAAVPCSSPESAAE